ncbi:MAG: hypothetical protein LBD32_02295 [Cytophagales bacterium]|jgi:hypothetical protein|nr:hypothetical protein [Cytophagales bacterium]
MFRCSRIFFYFLLLQSCSSFNAKQKQLHRTVVEGDYPQANKILDKDLKSERNSRNKLLYYMDRGIVAYLDHDYEKSNEFFNLADNIHEDQTSGVGDILLKYTINPSLTTYLGEDHEIFFIHYYKTLNYLALGQIDEALVECRRLNTELEVLSDKYKDQKKVYCKDAFAHTLMGIVYQAGHDYNNAFVAYRNAVEIFEDPDYQEMFQVAMPKQLQRDIIFVSYKLSDYENVAYYKKKFNLQDYDPANKIKDCGDLICFWNNGACPKKKNFSITFVIGRIGDLVTFTNTELGLFFAFPIPSDDIFDLQILTIAFPRYKKSFSVLERGFLKINDTDYELEKLEDVNKIALKTLSERMNYELGQMLLRFAIKKSSELALRRVNAYVGMAMGLFNAIAEKSDTRHWKNLPFEIFYSRIKLPEGNYSVQLEQDFNDRVTYDILKKFNRKNFKQEEVFIKKNQTSFLQFNTLFGSI